jgi:hypothetical protein
VAPWPHQTCHTSLCYVSWLVKVCHRDEIPRHHTRGSTPPTLVHQSCSLGFGQYLDASVGVARPQSPATTAVCGRGQDRESGLGNLKGREFPKSCVERVITATEPSWPKKI